MSMGTLPCPRWADYSAGRASGAAAEPRKERNVVDETPYPKIAMCWGPLRDDRTPMSYARHHEIMASEDAFGLEYDREPAILATGFKPESIQVARARVAELKRLNPHAIVIVDQSFYEWRESALPEDHPWWLRVDGKREQFWPGTYRADWNRPDYQEAVIARVVALWKTGAADGVFFDNWRDEKEPWLNVIGGIRKATGDDFLILINVGYDIGTADWLAPHLNGIMYESGWSHPQRAVRNPGETWDDRIGMMQHTESLLRRPRISLLERFEDVGDHAGWPDGDRAEQQGTRDPAARHWTLAYALIVGEFYYLFSDSTSHQHDWYPEYDVRIGLPRGAGRRVSAHVWERDYDKARVVMNLPDATQPYQITLDEPARDSFTGETGTRFTIPPGNGRILVRE
jgi:hypothetical protein